MVSAVTEVVEITADQFKQADHPRRPNAGFFVQEREFYSALDDWYLGVVTQDNADKDFGYAVLAPDQHGARWVIRFGGSFETQGEAREQLLAEMERLAAGGKQHHPQ